MKKLFRIFCLLFALIIFFCAIGCKNETPENSPAVITDEPKESIVPNKTKGGKTVDDKADLEATPEPTATPTPAPTPAPSKSVSLKSGDKSEEVTKLQKRLYELAYFSAGATGYYGSVTEAAVKSFQKQNGLKETGTADESTLEKLYSKDAVKNPKPAPTKTPAKAVVGASGKPLSGCVIGLDPGHQGKGDLNKEPEAPGSSNMKYRVSYGTQGRFTGVPEYQVTLNVALKLKALLEANGATVVMTRSSNNVNISNKERAEFFNAKQVDYALRIHCNGSNDPNVQGAFMLVPASNPYIQDCNTAASCLINAFCSRTGAVNMGVFKRSDQTGFNWCNRMIVNIELGHMTNEQEDRKLASADYQSTMAQGLLEGIIAYFKTK